VNGAETTISTRMTRTPATPVVLVGLELPGSGLSGIPATESLDELALLVDTWGGEVTGRILQPRPAPDRAWYVGRGKVEEIGELTRARRAECVVFDGELSPVQLRNLENELDVEVLDRTQVILDIFARRAHSREGNLQVELAQAVYALPRLTGKGRLLSRLGGGIGTRGPGETKLEVERRRLRDRISFLRRELAEVERRRDVQAKARRESLLPVAALVGYTNAGKSTLFNRLTGAGVLVEDRLFATLDPVVRRVQVPGNRTMLLGDTVGFIRRLPHHLVAAFRATLDEVRQADLLIHVVDASAERWPEQVEAATAVLTDIGAHRRPVVFALNKVDRLEGGRAAALSDPQARALARRARLVAVSALSGEGVDDLLQAAADELSEGRSVFSLKIPYGRSDLLSAVHDQGRVLEKRYEPDGVSVEVELDTALGRRYEAAVRETREA